MLEIEHHIQHIDDDLMLYCLQCLVVQYVWWPVMIGIKPNALCSMIWM